MKLTLLLNDALELKKEYKIPGQPVDLISVALDEGSTLAENISNYTFVLRLKLSSGAEIEYVLTPDTETTFEEVTISSELYLVGEAKVYIAVWNDDTLVGTSTKLDYKLLVTDFERKNGEISNGSVTTEKLADSSVTGTKINNGAVTTAKIADVAVTEAKVDTSFKNTIVRYESIGAVGTFGSAYCVKNKIFIAKAYIPFANVMQIPADEILEIRYYYVGSSSTEGYLFITAPKLQRYFKREVYSTDPWSAGNWEEVVAPGITALENTVGTLNTQLENALNGGA